MRDEEDTVSGLGISGLAYASTVRWRSTGSVNRWIDAGRRGSPWAYVSERVCARGTGNALVSKREGVQWLLKKNVIQAISARRSEKQ